MYVESTVEIRDKNNAMSLEELESGRQQRLAIPFLFVCDKVFTLIPHSWPHSSSTKSSQAAYRSH